MTTPNTPVWLNPTSPGRLSNQRGANTGGDALTMKTRYSNRQGGQDLAGNIRVTAYRTVAGGLPQAAQLAWDSGAPTVPAFPPLPRTAAVTGLEDGSSDTWRIGQRVYWVGPDGYVLSASIASNGIGSWRIERAMPTVEQDGTTLAVADCSIAQVYSGSHLHDSFPPILYALTASNVYFALINADGTLGTWTLFDVTNPVGATGGSIIVVAAGGNEVALLVMAGTLGTASWKIELDNGSQGNGRGQPDGDAPYMWITGPTLPAARTNGRLLTDKDPSATSYATSYLYYLGGDNGTTGQTTCYRAAITGSDLTIGNFAAMATALPAARTQHAAIILNGFVYVMGGSGTTNGAGTTSIYRRAMTDMSGNTGTAWATDATVLNAAITRTSAAALGWPKSHSAPAGAVYVYWAVLGGTTTGAVAGNIVMTQGGQVKTADGTVNAVQVIVPPGLTAGQLGTGGVILLNADGSQDITFNYGAFGIAPLFNLADGDQIQVTVIFADSTNGDWSLGATTVIKIGQPPTIGSDFPFGTITTAQPTAAMSYVAGAGGGPQATSRIRVQRISDSAIVFDSGLRQGALNSILLSLAPLLLNGAGVYQMLFAISSTDVPMAGSSASAALTQAFTVNAAAAPGVPTAPAATPDHPNGLITVAWTNPNASTAVTNRVYYRLTGTTAWYLLKDGIAAVTSGTQQSVALMDQLALGVGYDFMVSAVGPLASAQESAGSTVVAATILPGSGGGYTAMLHLAGAGQANHVAIAVQGGPKLGLHLDAEQVPVLGLRAPLARYGLLDYLTVELNSAFLDAATYNALMALLDQIQLTGTAGYYRDAAGTMVTVALEKDQAVAFMPASYSALKQATIKLVEAGNTYQPSTVYGSALGIPQQVSGSIVRQTLLESAL